jgi:predicted transcriptional regulator
MKEGVGRALRRAIGRDDVLSRIKPREGGVSLLMNEKRRSIFQHLLENPLTHLRELARETKIPVGTASWHLKILAEANIVANFEGRRRCYYYPSGWIESKDLPCLSTLQSGVPKGLYALIVNNPGLSQSEIAKRMGKYQQFVQPHIVSLEKCGFIRSKQEGRKKIYTHTDRLADLERKYERRNSKYLENVMHMLEEDGLNPKSQRRTKDVVKVKLDDGRNVFFVKIRMNPIRAIMR